MKDGRNSVSFEETSARDSISTEASLTVLSGKDEEYLEDESARVIWKASQPQDPVLSRLMEDALIPGNRARIVRTKSWTPSPNSCAFASSSSACNLSENISKFHRTNKRRTSSNNLLQEEAGPANDEFEKSAQRLVALLPLVSKQVDENAKREQEQMRQKRRKEKKASRRPSDDPSAIKKRRSTTDVKGKRRAIDKAHEEEISTIVDDSPSEEVHPGGGRLCNEVASEPLPCQIMPPPSFIPLRKSWSGDGSFPSAFTQRLGRSVHISHEAESRPVELPFSTSSFIATSTPRSLISVTSVKLADEIGEEAKPEITVDNDTPHASMDVASTLVPAVDDPSPGALSSTGQYCDTLHTPPPIPSQPRAYNSPSQVPTQGAQSLPKPSGRPVLGMRRLPHNQSFSVSQDRPLPTKREKFRVPFAKPKLDSQNNVGASTGASDHSASKPSAGVPSLNGCSQNMPAYSDSDSTEGCKNTSLGTRSQMQSSQQRPSHTPPTNLTAENLVVEKTGANRSSPPPTDGDSSMDFDMGIDPEELERICSAYD